MLYDPKWNFKTKADPYSLASLIAWLETQNPRTEYDYHDCGGACLISQHLTAQGENWRNYPKFADFITRGFVAGARPFTFGAALDRARAAAR